MSTVKKSVVKAAPVAVKKVSDANAYAQNVFASYARINGNATKVSTVANSGKYLVHLNLNNGVNSLLTSIYLLLSGGKKRLEIPADQFINALKKVGVAGTPEDSAAAVWLKRYHVETKPKKPFKNLKTVVNRLASSVRKGATLAFVPADPAEYEALLGK